MKIFSVRVKDQFDQVQSASAKLDIANRCEFNPKPIAHYIDYIEINGERIKPSVELLFQSENSQLIYQILEA